MVTTMLIVFYILVITPRPIRTGYNQHTHTGNTRQPELNSRVSRVHPPSRAQLEGCHSELNSRNATCLTPISSSTQGICSELNSRNTSNPSFEASPKALYITHVESNNSRLQHQNCLAGDTYRQALPSPNCLAGDAYRQVPSALEIPNVADTAWRDCPYR
ncbi:hypothetical protein DEO72_LG2g4101 [Vigna unguiculata]|uniref:Uncharacterized protein n=1 Tax=Vigna unguiculata TaxID=3917 RepID=A0A4D6L5P5_VIGUN|nr:hypothetical protein DEO72_LG2g4101 [Vigna unguiculata]